MTAPISPLRTVGDKIAEIYQHRIMSLVAKAIAEKRSGAVMAPTGSGKSLLATGAVEDSLALRLPVMILHPDVNLLRQNLSQFLTTDAVKNARISAFVARDEKLDIADNITRNDFTAEVIVASNMSLTNKLNDPDFINGLKALGKRGVVVLIDEGQKAAAEKLSEVLEIISDAGGIGIVLTATPFRTDGQDPLTAFGASIEDDMIAVAEFDEVLASGRIVKTRFTLAGTEFEDDIGEEATQLIESAFLDLLRSNKSIEQASQGAFSRFFKNDASKEEHAIGDLIVKAVANIWRRRAATSRIAMIHCDSVAFADALAQHIATTTLPQGHPLAGQNPNVGYVVATDTTVYRDGAPIPFSSLGWTQTNARENLLHAARQGDFQVLVNVNALGVGIDLPATDLNVLACRARSIGPVKQLSGRGERYYPETSINGQFYPVKDYQDFVDIGSSIFEIYRDIDAMRRGDPERSRRHIRELSPDIRRQFEAWFDADPDLAEKIRRRQDELLNREPVETETYVDRLDDSMRNTSIPREPEPFARGLLLACKPYRAPDRQYYEKIALYLDLEALGVVAPPTAGQPEPARWMTVVRSSATGANHAFLSSELENAKVFAAFYGVSDPPESKPADVSTPATDKQASYVSSLASRTNIPAWAQPIAEKPGSKSTASGAICLWQKASPESPWPTTWLSMIESGSRHLLSRAIKRTDLEHPIRAIALDRPNAISKERLRLIAAAAKLRSMLAPLAPAAYDRPSHISVISYDSTINPEIPKLMRDSGARFSIIDPNPEDAERSRSYLAELIGLGRIVATSPEGDADAWLRGKANLPRKDEAARLREKSFRDYLADVLDHGSITLTASELEDVVKALKGRKSAPVGTFVAALLQLLSPAAMKKATDIDALKPPHKIDLPIGALCAGYAQSSAATQKDVLAAIQRLADFRLKLQKMPAPIKPQTNLSQGTSAPP